MVALVALTLSLPGREGTPVRSIGSPELFDQADGVWVAAGVAYVEAPRSLPAGDVVLGLEVRGELIHNVVLEGVNEEEPIVHGRSPGRYAAPISLSPGSYTYYCAVGGHRAAGMEGAITVG